jgi:hypothetical protein
MDHDAVTGVLPFAVAWNVTPAAAVTWPSTMVTSRTGSTGLIDSDVTTSLKPVPSVIDASVTMTGIPAAPPEPRLESSRLASPPVDAPRGRTSVESPFAQAARQMHKTHTARCLVIIA